MEEKKQSPVLIGVVGNIGVGKSLVANYLIKKGFSEYSFAKPVKDIALTMGFSYEQLYGTQYQKLEINKYWEISGREFLQKLGTDIGRNVLQSVIPNMNMGLSGSPWVRLFEIHWDELVEKKQFPNLVVSDCRFPDEVSSIKDRGGYIIKITRPASINNGAEHKHVSETLIDNLYHDILIVNDASKETLFQQVDTSISFANKK